MDTLRRPYFSLLAWKGARFPHNMITCCQNEQKKKMGVFSIYALDCCLNDFGVRYILSIKKRSVNKAQTKKQLSPPLFPEHHLLPLLLHMWVHQPGEAPL